MKEFEKNALKDIADYVGWQGDRCEEMAELYSDKHDREKLLKEASLFKAKAYCWSAILLRLAREG